MRTHIWYEDQGGVFGSLEDDVYGAHDVDGSLTDEVPVIGKASPRMFLNRWKSNWKWQEMKVPTSVWFTERRRPRKEQRQLPDNLLT